MSKKLTTVILTFLTTAIVMAQTSNLVIEPNIRLPKDSIECLMLITNLDSFLIGTQQELIENKWVLPSEKSETEIIIGEIKEINKRQKNDISLRPHLTNIIPINKDQYLIQFAYLGLNKEQPFLGASFEVLATRKYNTFLFSSILLRNTKEWKVKTDNNLSVYYQSNENEIFINKYINYINVFDKKLSVSKSTALYFCEECETLQQCLQLPGIFYQLDYNGLNWSMTNFDTPNKTFYFFTKSFFHGQTVDPHDIFHDRVSIAIPDNQKNHYMICGCAYVYGGSWLISWEDIQKTFNSRMSYDKKTDWLELYLNRYEFSKNQEQPLYITQFINALIIEKTEKEQGFSSVMKLLASGNMYKEKDKFFSILNEVTGINEKNFNREIGVIVDNALRKL